MKYRIAAACLLATVGMLLAGSGPSRQAQVSGARELLRQKGSAEEDVNQLKLEVKALQGLLALEVTLEQMKELQELLKPTLVKDAKRQPGKAGEAYRRYLKQLRDALVANDEDDIDTYATKVDVLEEETDLDDDVVVPPLAWNTAMNKVLPLLTARQVVEHLKSYEEFPGPVSILLDTLEEGVKDDAKEWEKDRQAAVRKIGWLVGGQIGKGSKELKDKVKKWLDEKHALSETELKKNRGKLEKEARAELFPKVTPMQVLNNLVIYDVAEMLANPRFADALAARIAAESKPKK